MNKLMIIALCLSVSIPTLAKRLHTVKWYQHRSCTGAIEYRLPDRTRVDCLTDTHAIEHDFASKWAEAIGQALHYGSMTGRKPGIILIKESSKDDKHIGRAQAVIDFYGLPIDLWVLVNGEGIDAAPVLYKPSIIKNPD